MSEYLATQYEGTRLVPGGPGHADDAWAKDKAMPRAQDVKQPLQRSPARERKR